MTSLKCHVFVCVLLACLFVVSSGWSCHHWTAEDRRRIRYSSEENVCRARGYTMTFGNNRNYPGCGSCFCCKPVNWNCYNWTLEDRRRIPYSSEENVCRSKGNTMTFGNNANYPGCGSCFCCKPV